MGFKQKYGLVGVLALAIPIIGSIADKVSKNIYSSGYRVEENCIQLRRGNDYAKSCGIIIYRNEDPIYTSELNVSLYGVAVSLKCCKS